MWRSSPRTSIEESTLLRQAKQGDEMTGLDGIRAIGVGIVIAGITTGCVGSGKYKDLDAAYRQSQTELAGASARIDVLEGDLVSAADRGTALEGTLSEKERAIEALRANEALAAQRIAAFQELTDKFSALVDAGMLKVSVVNGRMVVQMQTDVLFSSGSARLSKDGQAAIEEVSDLLASLEERRYQIEGHTDDLPIHTTAFPSNWELAAARAISVVSVMTENGMDPKRVSGVSYGEAIPIASNDTDEGKAMNRRIEIVVVPDLSQLPGFAELQRISSESVPGAIE
jgi:chemotaxis protein MotB